MEDLKQTSFIFEIDNFSNKEGVIESPKFLCDGLEWFVRAYPKGDRVEGHLSLYLNVANPRSLPLGWKRRVTYSFVLLNKSHKELYGKSEWCQLFCAQLTGWGNAKAVPHKKLEEKEIMENNIVIIKVHVKVVEAVDEGEVTGNETLDIGGFQVLYSKVQQVSWIFMEHPDMALNFMPKSQLVKTTYMDILLGLIEKLNKPPLSFTKSELSNANNELIDLTKAGFKLDWLKEKLDEIFLERKKANVDGSRVEELEEHVKNLKAELNKEKDKSAAKFLSMEQRVLKLGDKLNMEMVKSAASAAKVLSLEKTVNEMNKKQKVSPH